MVKQKKRDFRKKQSTTIQIVTYRKRKDSRGESIWFAEIEGKPGTKVSGKTQVEVVGRLVIAKHRLLRLQIVRDEIKDF